MFIGSSVTSISSHAFEGNRFTSVIIPDNVKSIGDQAFYGSAYSPPIVTIGADVSLDGGWSWIFGEVNGFGDSYIKNGRKAGTYTFAGIDRYGTTTWNYSPRQ